MKPRANVELIELELELDRTRAVLEQAALEMRSQEGAANELARERRAIAAESLEALERRASQVRARG